MSRRSFGTIRKLESGRYQVRYRNSTGRMVPGPGTFATKADAQRWLATAEVDQLRGTFVDQRGLRLTFDQWAEEWLATKPGQAATLARDHAAIRTHFSPAIGQLGLPAITRGQIRSIVAAMQAAGLSPKLVRTYVGTLQAIFSAAVDSDLLTRSPVRPRARPGASVEARAVHADRRSAAGPRRCYAAAPPGPRPSSRHGGSPVGRGDRATRQRCRPCPAAPQHPPDRRGGQWTRPGPRPRRPRPRSGSAARPIVRPARRVTPKGDVVRTYVRYQPLGGFGDVLNRCGRLDGRWKRWRGPMTSRS